MCFMQRIANRISTDLEAQWKQGTKIPTSYTKRNKETAMQKVLHINPDKCTGCLQCEMACSYENYQVFAPAKSRIKVFDFHKTGKKVPYTCTQCAEAWCLHACPVQAITVDKNTGAKVVNDATCVGCKVCTIACPFGTVNYVQETGKVQKCDLCEGNPAAQKPAPPARSRMWMRTGRVLARWPIGPTNSATSRARRNETHKEKASCLGLEKFCV